MYKNSILYANANLATTNFVDEAYGVWPRPAIRRRKWSVCVGTDGNEKANLLPVVLS